MSNISSLPEIGNGQYLEVKQLSNGDIAVYKSNKYGALLEMGTIIEPNDFLMMLKHAGKECLS